jgi:hypothetical protein
MMDQYLETDFEPDLGELIDLHEEGSKVNCPACPNWR